MEQVTEIAKSKITYTAKITLTNSGKVGFTRRDLALCLYPPKVVEKADRIWERLIIDGARSHEDNPPFINKIWAIIPKQLIYNGTVKKVTERTFDWAKIAKKLCKDYNLSKIALTPERRKEPDAIVDTIEITSNTSDFDVHAKTIYIIIDTIHKKNPQLTYSLAPCKRNIEDDKCPRLPPQLIYIQPNL